MTAVVQPTFRLADGRESVKEQLEAAAALAVAVRFDAKGILMMPDDCLELGRPFAETELEKIEARLAEEGRTWENVDDADTLQVDWTQLFVRLGDDPPPAG